MTTRDSLVYNDERSAWEREKSVGCRVLQKPGDQNQPMPNMNDLVEIKTMLAQRIPTWIQEGELRGEAQGKAIGEAQGEAKTLLKLLSLKFGVMPDWIEEKINSADKSQLDCWVERILVSDTLEQLFSSKQA